MRRRNQTMSIAAALSVMSLCESATPEQIKKAYRRLAMQTHPDKGGEQADFIKVKEAYDCLKERGTVIPRPAPIRTSGVRIRYGNYVWVQVHAQYIYSCTNTA